jgi:hypothetical protein
MVTAVPLLLSYGVHTIPQTWTAHVHTRPLMGHLMPAAVDSGLPGVNLAPGDHICGYFFGIADRDELLLSFLRAGLQSGEKCMCIVDATEPEHVVDGLDAQLDDTHDHKCGQYVESEQLDMISASPAYPRTGGFSTRDMIEFFRDFTAAATGLEGYETVRVAGETTQPPERNSSSITNRSSTASFRSTRRSPSAGTTSNASAAA